MEKRVKVHKLTPHDNIGTAYGSKERRYFQIILNGKVIDHYLIPQKLKYPSVKAALKHSAGTNIVISSCVISRASIDIQSGELVHIHNVKAPLDIC